jgi:hypothetical protein
MMNQDPAEHARLESRIRNINAAVRMYWREFHLSEDIHFRIGIELKSLEDVDIIDSIEFSNFVDTITKHVVQYDITDKLMTSDKIYNAVASYWLERDITIELVNISHQPVLSTYYFNNLPSKEK